METNNCGMQLLLQHQIHKEITINKNFALIDAVIFGGIKGRQLKSLPTDPKNGDKYIVANDAIGELKDQVNKIVIRVNDTWHYIKPGEGTTIWAIDEKQQIIFLEDQWKGVNDLSKGYFSSFFS